MDILMTGATGFIGARLLRKLALHNRVFALTRGAPDSPSEAAIEWIVGDLADIGLGRHLPRRVDAVVHLAQSRHHRGFPEQVGDIFDVNIRGIQSALEFSREAGASRFVFTSSANVYRRSRDPIDESGALEPDSYYGRSKRIGELLVESYAPYFDCLIARLFTVYGPGQRDSLIPTLAKRVLEGKPVTVSGAAGLALSPIFVEDVVDILASSVRGTAVRGIDVVNVAADEATNVLDITRRLGELFGRQPVLEFQTGDDSGWVGDNRLMRERWTVPRLRGLDDGLASTFTSQ